MSKTNTCNNSKMGDPNHPHQLEAKNIFQAAWLDLEQGQHHAAPPSTHDIINKAADKLVTATEAKPSTQTGSFLYSTLSAIVDQASQSPASLDMMLQIYYQAANKLPAHDYDSSPKAAIAELNWWIAEEADRFNTPLHHAQTIGNASESDSSNPRFRESDVRERMGDVIERIREWREARVRCTIMSAAMGRCYALDLVRGNEGRTAIAQVDAALDAGSVGWSEAGFLGAMVMLRACAASLALKHEKVAEWTKKLEALLCGEGVSFVIKSNAELILRNLRNGPYDETSEELFRWKDWLL